MAIHCANKIILVQMVVLVYVSPSVAEFYADFCFMGGFLVPNPRVKQGSSVLIPTSSGRSPAV